MLNKKVVVLDTSAILSGRPLPMGEARLVTSEGVDSEFSPGGRNFRRFELLKEAGLKVCSAEETIIEQVRSAAKKSGDDARLSDVDVGLIAVALSFVGQGCDVSLWSDDFSIQNVCSTLNIKCEGISISTIQKRFKWRGRCRGCGRYFSKPTKECPVCGSEVRPVVVGKKDL